MSNVDPNEIKQFSALADDWWDPNGSSQLLHKINPPRLEFILKKLDPNKKYKILDIGCGGGILSESLAKLGHQVTGIDLSDELIKTAKNHAKQNKIKITYQKISTEDLAEQKPGEYDIITCMELLEHVPDPSSIIQACAKLAKTAVFFSTINRTPKAYLKAILGAEYLLKLLPKQTHQYKQFIQPSELNQYLKQAGLKLNDITGMTYNPLTQKASLISSVDVNYLVSCIITP